MNQPLFIRIPPDQYPLHEHTQIQWQLFSEGTPSHSVSISEITSLRAQLDELEINASSNLEVIIFLTGRLVNHQRKRVNKKQHKHLDSALPYLMEDGLTDELKQLHFAQSVHDQQGNDIGLKVSSIRHADMKPLLNLLNSQQLSPQIIVAESELFDMDHEGLNIWVEQGAALVQQPDDGYLAMTTTAVPFALLNAQENEEYPATAPITLWHSEIEDHVQNEAVNKVASSLAQFGWPVDSRTLPVTLLTHLAQCFLSCSPSTLCNLRSGDYKDPSFHQNKHRLKSRLLMLAGCWLLLELGIRLGEGVYFQHQAEQYWQDSATRYLQSFPQDRQVQEAAEVRPGSVDIQTRLQSRLNAATIEPNAPAFLPLLAKLSNTDESDSQGQIKPESLSFNHSQQTLQLEMETDSLASVDQYLATLKQSGLKAQLDSANQSDNRVIARLTIAHPL
ncbi:type II secretion system protein GspL [Endozoicomonas numazuensis]|uniref:Type II secretion system protein L n=1 Tax=Endozoicomonas numazuensis TaxID=1137799 RepID=A0A081NHZ5_9GAMM|nr:type II secretion system protein GspL [Endozoicomonas numazuensis]KEQ18068.1 hypothetical protein GZ78_10855 [Endozoicomonas numazuensis]